MSTSTKYVNGTLTDYGRFLSKVAKIRQPDALRELGRLKGSGPADLIFLGGGYPSTDSFPFEKITVTTRDGHRIDLDQKAVHECQQYQPTKGYPVLIEQLREHQKRTHNPPLMHEREIITTVGCNDGIVKTFEMLLNPGDPVVLPNPLFTGILSGLRHLQCQHVVVKDDGTGIKAKDLRRVLEEWIEAGRQPPKVIYLNPVAVNPTGSTIADEERDDIYKIICEYDMILLEDDPYYHITFDKKPNRSFLSLDVQGRVVRFDSFSKTLGPGLRLGFATGPKELIRRIEIGMQCTVLGTSSIAQVMVSELLKQWGVEGFENHIQHIRELYKKQRDCTLVAAGKHLTGLAEWVAPTGGMFLWMNIPGVPDTNQMLLKRGFAKNVLLAPGKAFMSDSDKPSQYLRAAYSLPTPTEIDEGFSRLAAMIREEQMENRVNGTNGTH